MGVFNCSCMVAGEVADVPSHHRVKKLNVLTSQLAVKLSHQQ